MGFARLLLYVAGVSFAVLGVQFAFWPGNLTESMGVQMPTPVALQEIRGVYGGLFFGVGLTLLLLTLRDAWVRPGLAAMACVLGGLVLGRTVGAVLDGSTSSLIWILYGIEVAGTVLALVAWRRLPATVAA